MHNDLRIIYHADDLDGRGSAAIALRRAAKERGIVPGTQEFQELAKAVLIPVSYNQPLPAIPEGARVILLDFSFPVEDMRRLATDHPLVYIDHHAPKIAELDEAGILELTEFHRLHAAEGIPSAIHLTWLHFEDRRQVPRAVELLSEYDAAEEADRQGYLWNFYILPFQHGLRSWPNNPQDKIWDDLLSDEDTAQFRDELIRDGEAILRSRKQTTALFGPKSCYITTLRDGRILACNGGSEDYFPHHPAYASAEILLSYRFEPTCTPPNQWKCTIWPGPDAPCLDVGDWAKAHFDGGGHRGCAGFHLPNPPMPVS